MMQFIYKELIFSSVEKLICDNWWLSTLHLAVHDNEKPQVPTTDFWMPKAQYKKSQQKKN